MCRSTRNCTYSVRTLLRIANIDSYSDKSFSELHAIVIASRVMLVYLHVIEWLMIRLEHELHVTIVSSTLVPKPG